ncbi:MAG: cysteine--tRNA ligase [Bacteroidota bacterium]|nr:cysteine--tRNA ligase [Bacteroidota bacterium]MDP4233172.1 cysteine--tRNA ligase [Bacteroidota bacterium]MDP4241683.1 cysteine--tRNA ligase [Bacteroidota bacterium]MDP4287341.1 cysteine--tRNA ligase [Bacteroidota bacterium]
MPLEIYNTLSRKKERFVPLREGHVGMYFCGPTVYGDAHVGHAKAYITADIVHRYLEFLGYDVTYVQNITDVGHMTDNDDVSGEDKLEVQSRKEKKHPMEIAEYYTRRYYEDMDALNVQRPDIAPRATGHIIEQIEMVKELIAKGFAYEVEGNVYFDVAKDKEYGKLSGRKTEDQESSGRVEARTDKRSPNDFALWKRAEKGHILHWPSPWGEGFPGWHIECSAMSMKYLGETFDIHGAGLENSFPHNECEIAQSECANGKPFVRYWMHNNMVTTGGVKMGKSLGNSAYLRDLYKQYDPLSLRFTILQSHYRGTTEFVPAAIASADAGYQKLLGSYGRLAEATEPTEIASLDRNHPIVRQFIEAMDDDFNTAKAIAVIYELATETNNALTSGAKDALSKLHQIWKALAGDVLGILPTNTSGHSDLSDKFDSVIQLLIRQRKDARARRDFAASDAIRNELDAAGIILEDNKEGTTWRLK